MCDGTHSSESDSGNRCRERRRVFGCGRPRNWARCRSSEYLSTPETERARRTSVWVARARGNARPRHISSRCLISHVALIGLYLMRAPASAVSWHRRTSYCSTRSSGFSCSAGSPRSSSTIAVHIVREKRVGRAESDGRDPVSQQQGATIACTSWRGIENMASRNTGSSIQSSARVEVFDLEAEPVPAARVRRSRRPRSRVLKDSGIRWAVLRSRFDHVQ